MKIKLSLFTFCILTLFSCSKEEVECPESSEECYVLIDGGWELRSLDEYPIYLDGCWEGLQKSMAMEIKYPPEARENGIEGIAIVQFEITTSGSVENIEIKQDPGGGIGEATKQVVVSATQGTPFSPGILDEKAVRVRKEVSMTFCLK